MSKVDPSDYLDRESEYADEWDADDIEDNQRRQADVRLTLAARAPGISASAKCVLQWLAWRVGAKNFYLKRERTQEHLAEETGTTDKTLERLMKELRDKNYIYMEPARNSQKSIHVNWNHLERVVNSLGAEPRPNPKKRRKKRSAPRKDEGPAPRISGGSPIWRDPPTTGDHPSGLGPAPLISGGSPLTDEGPAPLISGGAPRTDEGRAPLTSGRHTTFITDPKNKKERQKPSDEKGEKTTTGRLLTHTTPPAALLTDSDETLTIGTVVPVSVDVVPTPGGQWDAAWTFLLNGELHERSEVMGETLPGARIAAATDAAIRLQQLGQRDAANEIRSFLWAAQGVVS